MIPDILSTKRSSGLPVFRNSDKKNRPRCRFNEERRERHNKYLMLETFIKGIESRPLALEEFDVNLWAVAVENVKVMPDGRLVFHFREGTEKEGSLYLAGSDTMLG